MQLFAVYSATVNPNGFAKAKAGGQKILKHLQNVCTKNDTKHWLYTVLCPVFI